MASDDNVNKGGTPKKVTQSNRPLPGSQTSTTEDDFVNFLANLFQRSTRGPDAIENSGAISFKDARNTIENLLSPPAPEPARAQSNQDEAPIQQAGAQNPFRITDALSLGIPEELAIGIQLAVEGLSSQSQVAAQSNQDFADLLEIVRQNIGTTRQGVGRIAGSQSSSGSSNSSTSRLSNVSSALPSISLLTT